MTDTQSTRIAWTCAACNQPIADGTGYLHVDLNRVREVEDAHAAHLEQQQQESGWRAVNLTELLALPRRAPWLAHHRRCDPNPGHGSYWFDVARARTHAQLLNWSAHLMGKRWIRHTTWADLIERAAGVDA